MNESYIHQAIIHYPKSPLFDSCIVCGISEAETPKPLYTTSVSLVTCPDCKVYGDELLELGLVKVDTDGYVIANNPVLLRVDSGPELTPELLRFMGKVFEFYGNSVYDPKYYDPKYTVEIDSLSWTSWRGEQ